MRLSTVLVAVAAAALLTACSAAIDASTATPFVTTTSTPVPVLEPIALPPECAQTYKLSDEEVIASDVLAQRSDELVFDQVEWDVTVSRARTVLEQVRSRFAPAQHIAPEFRGPRQVALTVYGTFAEQILAQKAGDFGELVVGRTGDEQLNDLDEQFGAKAIIASWTLSFDFVAELCLDPRANWRVAVEAYKQLTTVGNVRHSGGLLVGDAPGLGAAERDGNWFVVVREASGDCPSGCISERLSFFRARGTDVTQIPQDEAAADPFIVALANRVRRRTTPWPTAASTPTSTPATLPQTGGQPMPSR